MGGDPLTPEKVAWMQATKAMAGNSGKMEAAAPAGHPVKVKAPNPGSGGATHDASSITFTTTASLIVNGTVVSKTSVDPEGAVEIGSGQSGQLLLFTKMESFEDNVTINQKASQNFTVSWDVSADDSGQLTIGTPSERFYAGGRWPDGR